MNVGPVASFIVALPAELKASGLTDSTEMFHSEYAGHVTSSKSSQEDRLQLANLGHNSVV
ncbi:hypothetical protein OUZ56_029290 [Daphnia magna]|uniref:Uncharacterized protein n=1 Tax=Daphnia magna TaxID=35525 RepID=A0ABR0B6D6_9CRUS|nr:hypothetical protein OUZ56_029290 [Daphnia magna]